MACALGTSTNPIGGADMASVKVADAPVALVILMPRIGNEISHFQVEPGTSHSHSTQIGGIKLITDQSIYYHSDRSGIDCMKKPNAHKNNHRKL